VETARATVKVACNTRETMYQSVYQYVKYISIGVLVLQHVSLVLVMHYSGISGTYLTTTVVVCVEFVKLVTSMVMVKKESGDSDWMTIMRKKVFHKPREFLKTGVPGTLYVVQNNLQFIAVKHLAAAEYVVMFQLKILATALLSVIVLEKTLSRKQWVALILLFFGAALVETPSPVKNNVEFIRPDGTNHLLGIISVLIAVSSSGFAGVFTEKILKDTLDSIWVRNIQLSLFGLFFGSICAGVEHGAAIMQGGFFQGYDLTVAVIIVLHALGGLTVAVLLKYGDNILKCFAGAFGLVLTYVCQRVIEPGAKSFPFFLPGACIIIGAVPMYLLNPVETSTMGLDYKTKTRYTQDKARGMGPIGSKSSYVVISATCGEDGTVTDLSKKAEIIAGLDEREGDDWETDEEPSNGEDIIVSAFGNRKVSWFCDDDGFKEAV